MIDSGIFPQLMMMLDTDSFDIKKEACWAVSNATSGGSPAQLRAVAAAGCVPALVALLASADARVVARPSASRPSVTSGGRHGAREAEAAKGPARGAPNDNEA